MVQERELPSLHPFKSTASKDVCKGPSPKIAIMNQKKRRGETNVRKEKRNMREEIPSLGMREQPLIPRDDGLISATKSISPKSIKKMLRPL